MPKRILIGTVVSDKTDKTVVVKVERKVKHPLYGKIIRRSKKYHAHDEDNAFKTGETVRIEETRPMSKLKTWKVIERVTAGRPLGGKVRPGGVVPFLRYDDRVAYRPPNSLPAVESGRAEGAFW